MIWQRRLTVCFGICNNVGQKLYGSAKSTQEMLPLDCWHITRRHVWHWMGTNSCKKVRSICFRPKRITPLRPLGLPLWKLHNPVRGILWIDSLLEHGRDFCCAVVVIYHCFQYGPCQQDPLARNTNIPPADALALLNCRNLRAAKLKGRQIPRPPRSLSWRHLLSEILLPRNLHTFRRSGGPQIVVFHGE